MKLNDILRYAGALGSCEGGWSVLDSLFQAEDERKFVSQLGHGDAIALARVLALLSATSGDRDLDAQILDLQVQLLERLVAVDECREFVRWLESEKHVDLNLVNLLAEFRR